MGALAVPWALAGALLSALRHQAATGAAQGCMLRGAWHYVQTCMLCACLHVYPVLLTAPVWLHRLCVLQPEQLPGLLCCHGGSAGSAQQRQLPAQHSS